MDILLGSGVDSRYRDQLERNPEAIFDILTMKSSKGRSSKVEWNRHVGHDGFPQNEADYEAFVQQFPIDDSISECFAFSSDNENKSSVPKFITGAKRPQVSKYSKLKKKLGWGTSEENLNMADEPMSSDTKRSKKGGGVQSKRHKWRRPVDKAVNFADMAEFDPVGDVCGSVDARMNESRDKIYSNMAYSGSCSESSGHSHSATSDQLTGADDVFETDSPINQATVYSGPSSPIIPPRLSNGRLPDYANLSSVKKEDCFSSILVPDQVALMKNLENLSSDVANESRDDRGNTLLHRCVELGSPDGVYMILDRFPTLSSDMNSENMTAIELAVKLGKVGCLKVMLDRNKRNKALGTPLLNRLLNISGSHGQADCLRLLLSYMPTDQHNRCSLPGDTRGNTAAHSSAKHGHLKCLQTLVTSGYDVTAENLIHQRPLQVAQQNSRHDCFEYLMLLDICEKLLNQALVQTSFATVLRQQSLGVRTSIEQLQSYLHRYQKLFEETRQSLEENKESILETLVNIHEDLLQVTEYTGNEQVDKQHEIRDKLDELAGEIERLEDTFEFSPLDDLNSILSRVLKALEDALMDTLNSPEIASSASISETILKASLSKLMREAHEDAMAENWNITLKVDDIISEVVKTDTQLNELTLMKYTQQEDLKEMNHSFRTSSGSTDTQKASNLQCAIDTDGRRANVASVQLKRELSKHKENESQKSCALTVTNNGKIGEKKESKPKWADLGKKVQVTASSKTTEQTNELPKAQATNVGPDADDTHGISNGSIRLENTDQFNNKPADLRQLSLDERMDLLIAGERAREKLEDEEYIITSNKEGNKNDDLTSKPRNSVDYSMCTSTTFTSITSDSSDFSPEPPLDFDKRKKKSNKFSFTSSSTDNATSANLVPVPPDLADSVTSIDLLTMTSDSTSYWWDVEEDNRNIGDTLLDRSESLSSDDLRNLQEEKVSNEELRRRRVQQHIRALQRTRFPSSEFAEKITTSTGETMGGFDTSQSRPHTNIGRSNKTDKRIVVDVDSALRARAGLKPIPMPRNRKTAPVYNSDNNDHTERFATDDEYNTFQMPRDQDLSSLDVQWEDMFMSDDDVMVNGKRWYEMSDDDVSLVPSWRSDDDTEGSRTPREI